MTLCNGPRNRTTVAAAVRMAGMILWILPAFACSSSSDLDPIKAQLTDLQVQILELQKQGPTKEQVAAVQATLSAQNESFHLAHAEVRQELRALTDQIEHLEAKLEDTNFRLTQLAQQITATNQELQEVRNAAEEARASVSPPPTSSQPGSSDPQALYDTAYNDYLQGNFDLAILGFRKYSETYPATDLADNAAYWIGECYYSQGKFQKAIDQFDIVLDRFQGSDRVPSVMLKKGYAYLELGQRAPGIVQLQKVICEFAGTDEAHLAKTRLEEMDIDVDC